jgi:hypothetical protein
MSTEELIREIISKKCPFHGKHPTVEIHEAGEMDISTCCEEFREHIGTIVNSASQNTYDAAGSTEIM